MDLAGTLINTFVVVSVGAILAYLSNDRFKTLRREIDGIRSELGEVRSNIARLEERLEGRLDAGLAAVHAEIVQVALAVGARGETEQG